MNKSLNKILSIVALLGLALPVVAQSKPKPVNTPVNTPETKVVVDAPKDVKPVAPVAKEETLTETEKIALSAVYKQYQETLGVLSQINIDTAKTHPGYHLDPNNPFSGKLVKDAPKETKAESGK